MLNPKPRWNPATLSFPFFSSGATGAPEAGVYTQARAIEDMKTFVMMNILRPVARFLLNVKFFHIGRTKCFWSYLYTDASHLIAQSLDVSGTA